MRSNFARVLIPQTTVLLIVGCTLFLPSTAHERTPGRSLSLLAQAHPAKGQAAEAAEEPAAEASDDTPDAEPMSPDEAKDEEDLAKDLGLTKSSQDNPRIVRRSLENILQKSQEAHDRILVDRFLIWVSVLFAMIALMLFLSQPPRRKKKEAQPLKAK